MINIRLVPVDDGMIAAQDLLVLEILHGAVHIVFAFTENIRKIRDGCAGMQGKHIQKFHFIHCLFPPYVHSGIPESVSLPL